MSEFWSLFRTIAQFLACGVICWHAICAVLAMCPKTNHVVRLGIALLATGCFAELVIICHGHVPDVAETCAMVGLCLSTLANRRMGICPCVMYRTDYCAKDAKQGAQTIAPIVRRRWERPDGSQSS